MSEELAGLDPDEPHTPAWLTFLGIGLFLIAGIFLLIWSSRAEEPKPESEGGSVDAPPAAQD